MTEDDNISYKQYLRYQRHQLSYKQHTYIYIYIYIYAYDIVTSVKQYIGYRSLDSLTLSTELGYAQIGVAACDCCMLFRIDTRWSL